MREVLETSWHFCLLVFTPAVKPKYRKLFVGIIVGGGIYHVYRSLTWRRGHVLRS